MCLEVKKKLEQGRNNNYCVRIKEEAIDIDEVKLSLKDNDDVIKTEISGDEGSKNNSFVDMEQTFGGEEVGTKAPIEEDPLQDSLFVIKLEETIKKDANRKTVKRKKNVSFFRSSGNVKRQKEANKRKEICMKDGNTIVDLERPNKNVRKASTTRRETKLNDRNAKVDPKPKKQISVYRSSKNTRHQSKTSITGIETDKNTRILDPKLKQTDIYTHKENNKSQTKKLIGKPKSKGEIDESVLIERACKTISILKEKNVSPKRFKCVVKMVILGENQLKNLSKRNTDRSKRSVQHHNKQALLNTSTSPSLEPLPPTQETNYDVRIDNGKEVNLQQQNKQKLLNTTTHPILEPQPPTQETFDDDEINNWEELNLQLSDTPSLEGDDCGDDDHDYYIQESSKRKRNRNRKSVKKSLNEPTDENHDDTQENWTHRIRKKVEQKALNQRLEGDENKNHIKRKRKIRDTSKNKSRLSKMINKISAETPKPENDIGTCAFFLNIADEIKKHNTVFLTVICPTCKNLLNNKYYDKAHKYICGKKLIDFEETKVTHQCGTCNEVFDDLVTLNSHCDAHRYEKSVVEQQLSS